MARALRETCIALALLLTTIVATELRAQSDPDDIYWDRRFPAIGINGTVNALDVAGTDVVLAGNFTEAGGLVVQNIVIWNSATYAWTPLGSGIRGQVYAVAFSGQDVFVGGRFDKAGGVDAINIARYNRASGTWFPILDGSTNGVNGPVRVLRLQTGALYVGGDFDRAGNLASPCLARLQVSSGAWEPLITSIVSLSVADPSVSAIAFDGTDMYVGGLFDRIDGVSAMNVIRKTGTAWSPLGPTSGAPSGVDGRVYCFAFRSNEVYIGGEFKQATNQGTNVFLTSNICYWTASDGSFHPLMPNGTNTNYNPRGTINTMLIWHGFLYAGGSFTDAGQAQTGGFARYDFSGQRQAFNNVATGVEGTVFGLADMGDAILLAGNFPGAGGIAAAGAALWNDVAYSPLTDVPDNGANGPVAALAISGSDLFVGGSFTVAGGRAARNIARWDGARWNSVGSGVDGPIYALLVVGSDLYVGGRFTSAGGVSARNVARVNITTGVWSAIGSGLPGPVFALTAVGNVVYAGGGFRDPTYRFVAAWSGGTWSSPGGGVSDTVRCLVAAAGTVYAGGDFLMAGSDSARRVASWDGTAWRRMGSGLSAGITGVEHAYAMAVDGGDIIVAGDFGDAGGIGSPYIARWNRTLAAWGGLGPGVGRGPCDVVRSVAVSAGKIYLGGAFLLVGVTSVNYVVLYNGTGFVPLGGAVENGVNDEVLALAAGNGVLYAGGWFTSTADGFANRIASYGTTTWGPLGGTITAGLNGHVHAIAMDGDLVYVAGEFTSTGTSSALRIIRWNNSSGAWSTLGPGLDGPVYALALDGDRLYVGGDFSLAGGLPARNIAVWSLSRRRWENLGDSLNNGVNGPVRCIAVTPTTVYLGGEFTSAADSTGFNRIAAWDLNSQRWRRLGAGADSTVLAIGVSGQNVYAGGDFFLMDGLPASHLARWEVRNNRWQRLGSGTNAAVRAIAVDGNNVYIGGDFVTAGTISAPHVARWDNATDFYDYVGADGVGGGSVEARVHAIAIHNGVLFVAGEFDRVGNDSGYANLARWNRTTKLWKRFGSGITGNALVPLVSAVAADDINLFAGGAFDRAGGHGSYFIAHWEGPLNRPASLPQDSRENVASIHVFPNPASDHVALVLPAPDAGSQRIEITDELGNVVVTLPVEGTSLLEQRVNLDVEGLPNGVYRVNAVSRDRTATGRIVIAR